MLAVSPTAMAQEGDEAVSRKVVLSDLDLNSAAGQRKADRRIAHAVTAVCPDRFERNLRRQLKARTCRNVARDSAEKGMAAYRSTKLAMD